MTDTDDDPTVEPEDGVCVCCTAPADVWRCPGENWRPEVCYGCATDGTYRDWLAEQVKAGLIAKGQPAADDTAEPA